MSSTFRRPRLAGAHLVALLVASLIAAVPLQNPASASTSFDCAIEAGSPGSNTTTDFPAGSTQDPFPLQSSVGSVHPIFGDVTYFAHGNGSGASTGIDITLANPVTSILVSIIFNEGGNSGEFEDYAITGKNNAGATVLNVNVKKANGDFIFADDGATSVTPLNGPNYVVPGAPSSTLPSSLSVARPIAPGESVTSLEIRWTSDIAGVGTARSAILVVIDGQGQPNGACTTVAAVAAPQQPSAPIVQSTPAPSPPKLTCDPTNVAVGSQVACQITGGDPGIDILWNASVGGVAFAGQGVTLDGSGAGTFAFVASLAGEIHVDLVAWGVSDVVVAVGPVPAGVPAGEGGLPVGWLTSLGLAAATVLMVRRTVEG